MRALHCIVNAACFWVHFEGMTWFGLQRSQYAGRHCCLHLGNNTRVRQHRFSMHCQLPRKSVAEQGVLGSGSNAVATHNCVVLQG